MKNRGLQNNSEMIVNKIAEITCACAMCIAPGWWVITFLIVQWLGVTKIFAKVLSDIHDLCSKENGSRLVSNNCTFLNITCIQRHIVTNLVNICTCNSTFCTFKYYVVLANVCTHTDEAICTHTDEACCLTPPPPLSGTGIVKLFGCHL